jgi:seryl-tRNA synthetase
LISRFGDSAGWEVSSCSNYPDYQTRKLGFRTEDGAFFHTVKGTACAVPRMLISILEQMQMENGSVVLLEVLRTSMRDREVMEPKPRKLRPNFLLVNF